MQVIFLIRQDDRKSLRMKSTAKQEHNLNLKRNSYIPKMSVDPFPVGSITEAAEMSEIADNCEIFRFYLATFPASSRGKSGNEIN